MPVSALDAPDRHVCIATAHGTIEVHSWDSSSRVLTQATSRQEGTHRAAIEPAGEWIWWFDDRDGDECGVWRRQRFGAGPGEQTVDATGLAPSQPAGLALGRRNVAVVGVVDRRDEYRVLRLGLDGSADPLLLYQHRQAVSVGPLNADSTQLSLIHSEHGDSRHPAVRVLDTSGNAVVGDLWDGPGLGVRPIGFAPAFGDDRLLVRHDRHGRPGLLLWRVGTGEQSELDLAVPGEVAAASWYQDGCAVLVAVSHHGRTRLHRVDLAVGGMAVSAVQPVGPTTGTVSALTTTPGGDAWFLWSSAADPPTIRNLVGEPVVAPPGPAAPPSVPVTDLWVDGPGGPVHALLRLPPSLGRQRTDRYLPLVIDCHGGPAAHDSDLFRAGPAAWVDHGFAVVQINYRGSTGYGTGWRDAIAERVGHTELADVVAVRDHLVRVGIADPRRVVLSGHSWGGYLTLLGLGRYPDRWSVGLATSPIADYLVAYADESEDLKAFDRSLFGGSPEQVGEKYRDASPLTYVPEIQVPLWIAAGRADPRCPWRQILSYVDALKRYRITHELYHYDAGHGSLADAERIRQMGMKLDFVARYLAPRSWLR
ncbi:S9 family peptidase [Natronosporangium hydrolyticum]|uniref:S9 family peptidase n=1 Tax=Natronosporangium hydrolyticum TaxID=2811111 RepID=A0A895YRU3_9ACTN|nr:prolyl oligopeptidase family serine peptidase [Natronosporangium hydrolyticum]QSB16738.1 S9 family peptidase [Natronosporangium hydrolyticum]